MQNTNTIVFIHGLNLNGEVWADWKEYFVKAGFICYSPSYPYHEGDPSQLRKQPNHNLRKLRFGDVVKSVGSFIDTLPEKPILIGHSMGGSIVQKLLELEKGVAGVCISSAPVWGIFCFKRSFIKSTLPMVNPLKGNSLFVPEVNWFHYAVCNNLDRESAAKIREKAIVPESRNLPRSLFLKEAAVDFKKVKQPILFIAGEKDNIIPAILNRRNAMAYGFAGNKKDFIEFSGRTHMICWMENWTEVASKTLDWIVNLK